MATLSPTSTSPAGPKPPTPERPGLWQAPAFVVGVGALAAVWLGRPLWPDNPERRVDRDLAAARQLLARPGGDAEHALRLAAQARGAAVELVPDRAGEAALLVGTAHLRLAERATADEADAHWQAARLHLQEADKVGVPPDDEPKLAYRRAKVGFHTGADPLEVVRQLEASADHADRRADAYALLTQAYLRLPTPDLHGALKANRRLRDLAEVPEAEVEAAKLVGGELLLRLGKHPEARKTLSNISDQAPAEVQTKAWLLSARSLQGEGKWAEAASLYKETLADARTPLSEPARVHYDLGLCHQQLNQAADAIKAWEKCVRLSDGPEGAAAALRLADLRLKQNDHAKALEALTRAVAALKKPADWANPLMDLKQAREHFTRAAEAFRAAGQYDLGLRLTEAYERLAAPGRAHALRGAIAEEGARLRQQRAAKAADAAARKDEEAAARRLFLQAAAAHAQAAERLEGKDKVEHLWLSATAYLAGGENKDGARQLEGYLKLDPKAGHQGEGWYRLGEAYAALGNQADALEAYKRSLQFSTPSAYHARHRLALAHRAAGDLDEAQAALKFNLRQSRWDNDLGAQEKSLYALGDLLYSRRDFLDAVRHLEEALGRFADNSAAPAARYQLADSYRQLAAQENMRFLAGEEMSADTRKHHQAEHRRWLKKAAEEFAKLDAFLATAEGRGRLTEEQRAQVPFVAAKCWFNYGDYEEALKVYELLIGRHPEGVEGLDALGGAVSCHAALGDADKVRQRLLEVRKLLPAVDEEARRPWEEWVAEASKELTDL